MSRTDDFDIGLSRRDADRLFREDAARRRDADPRLIRWFAPSGDTHGDDRIGRLLTTAFAVFCIVGGLAMLLGMSFVPAALLSASAFAAIGLVGRLF
ncbi:hypothetical protein ACRDNQ_09130 [Palleronia sp. KMU-117]|uniref:hypothetical protein n=1 Tax=Palleronia sp. KMU-117 TaxID=3434108 RepID=UPI003D73CE29